MRFQYQNKVQTDNRLGNLEEISIEQTGAIK